MPELFFWIGVFIVALFVLVKAADYFTISAEKIGLHFGMPAFIVGVTIVAVGTSLPELISSIIAVLNNASEIVVGNVVGSNIANIFLILGLAAVVGTKLKTTYEILHIDLPILVASAFLLAAMIWDGVFTIAEAVLLIIGMIVYLLYTISSKNGSTNVAKEVEKLREKRLSWKSWAMLVVSAFFLYIGAKYTIEAVLKLSGLLSIGTEIIAVSAVALGTSLPEVVVSVSAARKGKSEIAIGNILGSNIFNAFVVMGVPAFFGALTIPANIISFALPMMLIATILFFFMMMEKTITRWEGMFLLMFYIFFIGKLFNLF